MNKTFIKPEGHKHHEMSTGICDRCTFGSGELDRYGYWEQPCKVCSEAWQRQYPEYIGKCWPEVEINIHTVKPLN